MNTNIRDMNTHPDISDFQKEVIEQSYKIPVLVDFWGEWCAPCRALSPVLERLAEQNTDKWVLAKVNTEKLPDVAAKYNIQSIPNVKLFFEGRVAGEFVGALPEYVIVQWLRRNLPSKYQGKVDLAKSLMGENRIPDAQRLLENILAAEPENPEAKILLAKTLLFANPGRSAGLLANIDDPKFAELADAIAVLSRMIGMTDQDQSPPDGLCRRKYLDAIADARSQNFDAALAKFIDVIRNDRYYDDDGSRKACIAIFKFLGEEHEITQKHRRDFGSALYL